MEAKEYIREKCWGEYGCSPDTDGGTGFCKGYEAGIREVVEDLDNFLMLLFLIKAKDGNVEAMSVINHIKDREQAKLKEWEG